MTTATTPRTLVASAAPVAFVDDDEVEEIRRECVKQPDPPFIFGQRLVGREIHFAALCDLTQFDL